jgi:hypothetical protein
MKTIQIPRLTIFVVLLMAAVACASSEPKSDLNVDVDSDQIRVVLSTEVARSLVEGLIGADLDCKSEIDSGMESLLQKLQQDGPRSRATYRDGETTIQARRRGGRLDLGITGEGSGKIEATMPWAVAECLLGNRSSIDDTVTSSIKVKVTNENGRNFSFRLR